MSFFSSSKSRYLTTLQEQGGEAYAGVREAAGKGLEHAAALWQLLQLELKEYAAHQARRVVMTVLGCILLLFGYMLLCCFACVAVHMWLDSWLLAFGLVCLLHLLAGAALILVAVRSKAGQVAPVTRREIQNDWQCLKLIISKENSKS